MDPLKIPKMTKAEYDALIERQCISRISFGACEYSYIAPFRYVFDKNTCISFPQNTAERWKFLQQIPGYLLRSRNIPRTSLFFHL